MKRDKRIFINETGALIAPNNTLLHIIDGTSGEVEFPEELMWDLHKRSPGVVFKMAHTHPPEVPWISNRDKQTLQTWAFAFYPFPIRISVITPLSFSDKFEEKVFVSSLQPKELRKDKTVARKFEAIFEGINIIDVNDVTPQWYSEVIGRSYEYPTK